MKYKSLLIPVFSLVIGVLAGHYLWRTSAPKNIEIALSNQQLCADYSGTPIYICAMHTEFKQNQPGKCGLCNMDLALNLSYLIDDQKSISVSKQEQELMGITTKLIKSESDSKMGTTCFGVVEYDHRYLFKQMARLPGIIEKLYISDPGEYIEKGQLIAKVYSKELIAALESIKYAKSSPAIIRSAKNNIKNWGITESHLNQLLAKDDLYQSVAVYAEKSGIVTDINVTEGEFLPNAHMGDLKTLLELANPNRLQISLEIPKEALEAIDIGTLINLKTESPERIIRASIRSLAPQIDLQTGYTKAYLSIKENLKVGTTLIGQLSNVGEGVKQLAIPKTALLWGGSESGVYVCTNKGNNYSTYEWRNVEIQNANQEEYFIANELIEGDELVISGALRLDALAQLKGKKSFLNRYEPLGQVEIEN